MRNVVKTYYSKTACVADGRSKFSISNPLHSSLDDRHCQMSVFSSLGAIGELTSDAEGPRKLRIEGHDGSWSRITAVVKKGGRRKRSVVVSSRPKKISKTWTRDLTAVAPAGECQSCGEAMCLGNSASATPYMGKRPSDD